jgi:hypothetical protein
MPHRNLPTVAGLTLMILSACGNPTDDSTSIPAASAPSPGAVKFWEAGATVGWNEIARNQTTLVHPGITISQPAGVRTFAYLSLAQYNAAIAAEHAKDQGHHASPSAAVAGASAVVLSAFYPDQAAYFEEQVRAQESGPGWPGDAHNDFAMGEAVGRTIGAQVLASAQTDNFTSSVEGVTIPVCPGCWLGAAGKVPVFPLLSQMRPFFLASADQFRPGPPPAFGSAAYLAALQEVRQISDTRTPEQDAIAKFWASPGGFTAVIQSYNDKTATDEIVKFHLNEIEAAHVLAVTNMTAMDAFIACHDAKYTYWLIRPSQADPGIVPDIPLPNHPSYPSNHACVTGSTMAILAHFFPSDATRLNAMADEAGESRIFGGIHYRFDKDAGLTLGRRVAANAVANDINGHQPFALK